MAIPTDFKGFTPAANTTKTFRILGSATVGIWACDVDGTLSATCSQVPLAPNLILFMDAAFTDAQIATALQDYLRGQAVIHDGQAGGYKANGTQQSAFSGTTAT